MPVDTSSSQRVQPSIYLAVAAIFKLFTAGFDFKASIPRIALGSLLINAVCGPTVFAKLVIAIAMGVGCAFAFFILSLMLLIGLGDSSEMRGFFGLLGIFWMCRPILIGVTMVSTVWLFR